MNATSLMLLALTGGADPVPAATAPAAPVVVSTGAGCNGCGTAAAPAAPCGCAPAAAPTNLVDWMKSKRGPDAKPGLLSRLCHRKPKAAPAAVASPCCDPCATVGHPGTVVGHPGVVVPPPVAGTNTGSTIPRDMPKADPPKQDPPKADPPKQDPPKGGALNIPQVPKPPVTGASGTTSPY